MAIHGIRLTGLSAHLSRSRHHMRTMIIRQKLEIAKNYVALSMSASHYSEYLTLNIPRHLRAKKSVLKKSITFHLSYSSGLFLSRDLAPKKTKDKKPGKTKSVYIRQPISPYWKH